MLLRQKLMSALRTSGVPKFEKIWSDQKKKQVEERQAKYRK
jgi:hypothetical protein